MICIWVVIYNNVIIGLIIKYNRSAYKEEGGLDTALRLYASRGFVQSSQYDYSEIAALRSESRNCSRQLSALQFQYEELLRKHGSAELLIEDFRVKNEECVRLLRTYQETQRSDQETQIRTLTEENRKLREEMSSMRESWDREKDEIKNLGRELGQYREIGDVLRRCEAERDRYKGEADQLTIEVRDIRIHLEEAGRENTDAKRKMDALQEEIRSLGSDSRVCRSVMSERDQALDEVSRLKVNVTVLQRNLDDAIRLKDDFEGKFLTLSEEMNKEKDKSSGEVDSLRIEVKTLRNDLGTIKRDKEDAESKIIVLNENIRDLNLRSQNCEVVSKEKEGCREESIRLQNELSIAQGNLNALRNDKDAEIKKLNDEMLTLSIRIQDCNKGASEVSERVKEEADRLRITITGLQEELNAAKNERERAEQSVSQLNDEMIRIENKCKVDLSNLEGKVVSLTRDLENRGEVNVRLDACTEQLNRAHDAAQGFENSISSLNIKVRGLEDEKRGLQDQYNQCSTVQLGSLSGEIQRVNAAFEGLKAQFGDCQNTLRIVENFQGFSQNYGGLSLPDKVRRVIGDLEECYARSQNEQHTIESYNVMLLNVNNTLKDCNYRVANLENDLGRARQEYEQKINSYMVTIDECNRKYQDVEGRYSQFEVEIRTVGGNLQDCRQELQGESERFRAASAEAQTLRVSMEECQQNYRNLEMQVEQYRNAETGFRGLQDSLNAELGQCRTQLEFEISSYKARIEEIEGEAQRNATVYLQAVNEYNDLRYAYSQLLEFNSTLTMQIVSLRNDVGYFEAMANEAKMKYESLQREMLVYKELEEKRLEEVMSNLTMALSSARFKDEKVKEDWRIIDELLQLNQIIMTALTQLNKGTLHTIMKGENVILREVHDLTQEPVQRFSDLVTKFLDNYTTKPVSTASWNIFIGYLDDHESSREFKIDIVHRMLSKRFVCSYHK